MACRLWLSSIILGLCASPTALLAQASGSRVCIEHLPNCGQGMSEADRNEYEAMSPEQQRTFRARAEGRDDFLANRGSVSEATASDDFLAGVKNSESGDFLAEASETGGGGDDWLAVAAGQEKQRRLDEERRIALEHQREEQMERERQLAMNDRSYSGSEFRSARDRNRPTRVYNSDGYDYRAVSWFLCWSNYSNGDYSVTFSEIGTWNAWREREEVIERKLREEMEPIFRIRENPSSYNQSRFSSYGASQTGGECNLHFEYGPKGDVDYLYEEAARKLENRILDFRNANKSVFFTDSVGGDMGTLK